MGCSPSKGNHFGILGPMRKGRMLPPAPQEIPRDSYFEDGENRYSTGSTDGDTKERKAAGQTQTCQKEAHVTPQKKRYVTELSPEAVNMDKLGSQRMDNNTVSQKKDKHVDKQDVPEKKPVRKQKKMTRGIKGLKKKDKENDKPPTEQKVDFPEPLVKAHQAAYAFLNPSINKYDDLLGLLEQATQTQVSVQTMVAFMALRYEEIIQGLEEMADEGEKVLKETGEHLAWPSQMKNLSSSPPLKSGSANIEPPPDLLQQLLQYTTQRMQNVSQTVGGIGESALEEAVEYFASVSELLEEKLKLKHAVESRLMRILSRIEMASLRKPGPEDSALFSEDSGIGAESESLAGSERRHRRESCASTGTNRTTPASPMGYTSMTIRQGVSRQKLASQISPSVSLTSLNSLGSTCTIMANYQRDSLLGSVSLDYGEEDDNDDDDEEEMDRGMGDVGFRPRSNSSPVDREQQQPRRLPPKRIENPQNVEMTLKMKNAISGRIKFVPSQNGSAKTKIVGSPKYSKHQWTEDEEQSPKRPQTTAPRKAVVKKTPVAREQRSQSAESLRKKGEDPTLLELERTQKDLNQKLQRMSKSKACGSKAGGKTAPSKQNQGTSPAQSPAVIPKHPLLPKNSKPQSLDDKAGLIRSNSKKHEVEEDKLKDKKTSKGPIKATPPPSPPASPRPSSGLYRGRNSVKRLIDTFSQGIEDLEGPKVLGPLKGVRKCGVPVLPGLGNVEAVLSTGITSCRLEYTSSEKANDLDLDSLPPPPLEVLLDNSFESAQSLSTGGADDGAIKVGKSPVLKRAAVSHRLRASVNSGTVLPSKGGLPQASKVISLAKADQQDTSAPSKFRQPDVKPEADQGKEKDSLYQQDRKSIHLRHSSDSQRTSTGYVATHRSASREESADIQDGGNLSVPRSNSTVSTVPPSSVVRSQPPATPPMYRGRMLPSTPSTPSSLHRRLPSPHNFKRQPTPPSSASPPVNRKLTTPPVVQERLPSPPVTKQNILNSNSSTSYPFKAPSPPASPKVQRWSRENSNEDSSNARMISNARSVFCPASPSLFEAHPCPVPRPPQAWTSTGVSFLSRSWGSRGRFPVSVQGPRPFIRRSHSDRRASLNLPPRSPGISVAETCGSEPAICSQGLDDEPTGDEELWGSQSNLRAQLRSASHPDLCVVGQALHRD